MLRIIYSVKFLITILIVCNTNLLLASEDWVSDLRYKEYLIAANEGSAAAMYELGVMTERGKGTDKDIGLAIIWYQKAIENKNTSAYVRLGKLYLEGKSIPEDYELAFKYLQKAKLSKSSGAYYYLAIMYENGYGTSKNLALAKENYDRAAKWGHYGAQEKSKKIALLLKGQQKNKKQKKPRKKQTRKKQLAKKVAPKAIEIIHNKQTEIDISTEIEEPQVLKKFVTIKDVKKSLLSGMWFNGASPLGFLPSPRTYCIPKAKVGLRCVSKEIQKNTGREKIFYLIESTISDIDNYGGFTITYKNKVTKVDIFKTVTESGELYVSRIKVGAQKKVHVLKCSIIDKTVNCIKNGMQSYLFSNLIKKKQKSRVFISAFD